MKTAIPISFALGVLLCSSCKQGSASTTTNKANEKDTVTAVMTDTTKKFVLPAVPTMMTDPGERTQFVALHYWDNFDFADTSYVNLPDVTEQAWVNYCDLLNRLPLDEAQKEIESTIGKANASKPMFDYITDLADRYLYDPNSPMRNEEYYIPVLKAMLASPLLTDAEKIRPDARLKLARKNRLGTKATNFTYTLASGAQGTLYGLKTDYVLLFINNPGCHACSESIAGLKRGARINQLLAEKKLTILSLYTDEELDNWRKYQYEFPKEWINAYDKSLTIRDKELYDLRAIPTLYLLDKNKTVLLKDAAAAQVVETYLERNRL
ncbi:MAG: DUF5106 domain-containing protein [Mediterranea sp.]|jgi:hypothetical protein|nr:DUF5106 domain-containing protein [Mediterranea sp.]